MIGMGIPSSQSRIPRMAPHSLSVRSAKGTLASLAGSHKALTVLARRPAGLRSCRSPGRVEAVVNWEDTGLWHIALVAGVIAWAWALMRILTTRYSSAGTSAWLLAIIFAPYVGVPLYALFGGRKLTRIKRRKQTIRLRAETVVNPSVTGEIDRLLRGLGIPGATCGNNLELLEHGAAARQALIRMIADANEAIDLLTYVFKDDATGREMVSLLAAKAKSGVKIRLLYDSLGSHATRRSLFQPLVDAGGQVVAFMPATLWFLRSRTNLRNHRKLIVIDHRIVWSGGMNIGDEYLGPRRKRWIDVAFTLEGPAVQGFAEIFRSDWAFASGEPLGPPAAPVKPVFYGDEGVVQVVPSGPDVDNDPLYAALVAMAFEARERLWIATPYFVPNEPLNEALCFAAVRGIDVRVIVPRKSNHKLPDLARGPYLRDLQRAGAKIHLVEEMMHAKIVVMDDALALHGSANIDARSLFLNFEIGTICYSRKDVDTARRWIEALLPRTSVRPAPITQVARFQEGVMRLVAPLL